MSSAASQVWAGDDTVERAVNRNDELAHRDLLLRFSFPPLSARWGQRAWRGPIRRPGFMIAWLEPAYIAFGVVRLRSFRLPVSSATPVPLAMAIPAELTPRKRTGRMVRVDEDTSRRASRLDQSEATRRHAFLEKPLSFAEHQRKYPDAILVDEFGGDQRLQQFAAAPDMQRRPVRCLKLADLLNNVAVNTLRFLPVETVEAARDDVFRRLVERLGDRVVALVRPVGGEDLVGPAPQKHVELTGDSLANGLVQAIVQEGHGPASVGESVPRILLRATGRLHDAVESDLRDCNDLSHGFSPVFSCICVSHPEDERLAVTNSRCAAVLHGGLNFISTGFENVVQLQSAVLQSER
jgi:hypothetical protein